MQAVHMGPGGEGWGPAFLFVSLYKNVHPDPVSGHRGRHLRTPPTQPRAGRVGDGRRHRCEAASVGYAHAPGGEATMAGRGAWRLDGGARRVETMAPSSPPPVLDAVPHRLAMRRRFLATVPVGAVLETSAASNLRAPTRPMVRAPVGNAKTHSTLSHYDGVEHKWLPSPPPPSPPWASNRRPRHHIRRRLRRAARCVGAFAAAPPAQHARALSAIGRSQRGHELARLGRPSASPP